MGLDPALAAAATRQRLRRPGDIARPADAAFQLSLPRVLLDGRLSPRVADVLSGL
jgi:hypothetical protein